ncbi:hypothetical protein RCIA92 [Methanocella arvoryzae MRE50]|uniref:Uncharacterized protein n=1 Tax=Methanocella arvoryzae (strain DSM 22066 / NBRC 105507 / MRE50) TaxID=351160 RepID=Q0W4X9_METAR|nr:hypothetical protein RCIA92 [Methanocella arvoryzae MRE50]
MQSVVICGFCFNLWHLCSLAQRSVRHAISPHRSNQKTHSAAFVIVHGHRDNILSRAGVIRSQHSTAFVIVHLHRDNSYID